MKFLALISVLSFLAPLGFASPTDDACKITEKGGLVCPKKGSSGGSGSGRTSSGANRAPAGTGRCDVTAYLFNAQNKKVEKPLNGGGKSNLAACVSFAESETPKLCTNSGVVLWGYRLSFLPAGSNEVAFKERMGKNRGHCPGAEASEDSSEE